MTEDYQNGNLLIGYQLLSFIKISRTEDVYFAAYTAMIFTILDMSLFYRNLVEIGFRAKSQY